MSEKSTTPDLEDAIRRGLDAVTRHDFDTALSLWMPDGVWELSPGFHLLEMGPLVGHEAIRQLYEDVTGAFEDFEFAAEEVHDLGRGVTFSVLVQRGRPHGSGVFVERRYGGVAIWRGGRIARATNYTDIDEARAAAERLAEQREQGMSKESTTPDLVELAQSSFEAINRRDFEAFMSFWGPDPVSFTSRGGSGTFEGRTAVRGYFEDWLSSYEEFEVVAEEIVDLGNGVTYMVLSQRGRPVASSGEVRLRYASVGLSVNGLAVQVTNYLDIDEARAAAERLAEERG